ncbi:sporulation-induced protein [Conglomerata obtusa]
MNDILLKLINFQDLTINEIKNICTLVTELLIYEPNILHISSPVNVVGDIHGQFYDLLNMFDLFGTPKEIKFLFLGDYVDRGRQSVQTYLILLVYKIMYPEHIFLVRGNHEVRVSQKSSFREEILRMYEDENVYNMVSETFYYLLIGCIVDGRILCVHGGIGSDTISVGELQQIDRFNKNIDLRFTNIMWSDPGNVDTFKPSSRGAGYLFGEDQAKGFLTVNNLSYIIRSHQMCYDGYLFHFKNKNVITVWSAPNYMYSYANLGCILKLYGQLEICAKDFHTFKDVHVKHNQINKNKLKKFSNK